MTHLKIAGICLVSMFAMSMVVAGTASAAPLWLLCLEGSVASNTKYEDSSCTKALASGSWESVALGTKSDTITLKAYTLLLIDKKEATIKCDGTGSEGSGLIENTNRGLIKEFLIKNPSANCEVESGVCPGIAKVEGRNLPWKIAIFEEGGKLVTKIENSGQGNPGWAVECGSILDECNSPTGSSEMAELKNEVSNKVLLVTGKFEEKVKSNCTLGGAEEGEIKGLLAILLWNGHGLSINKA